MRQKLIWITWRNGRREHEPRECEAFPYIFFLSSCTFREFFIAINLKMIVLCYISLYSSMDDWKSAQKWTELNPNLIYADNIPLWSRWWKWAILRCHAIGYAVNHTNTFTFMLRPYLTKWKMTKNMNSLDLWPLFSSDFMTNVDRHSCPATKIRKRISIDINRGWFLSLSPKNPIRAYTNSHEPMSVLIISSFPGQFPKVFPFTPISAYFPYCFHSYSNHTRLVFFFFFFFEPFLTKHILCAIAKNFVDR